MLEKNLNALQKLCGKDKYRRIVITTTMWASTNSEVDTAREHELRCDFGAEAVRGGSGFLRFENTRQSAWHIIGHIMSLELDHRWIQTQAELVALRKDFPSAKIGEKLAALVEDVVVAQRHIQNRMKETFLETSDPGMMEEFMNELGRMKARRAQIITEVSQLCPSLLDRLHCLLDGTSVSSTRSTHATSSFLFSRCRDMITRISENDSHTALVCSLSGDEAQQVVNFLSMVCVYTASCDATDVKRTIEGLA